jgi:hypothetical protein
MRGLASLAALAVALAPGVALAQTAAPMTAVAEPDAARLALARQVIDQIMPPATREAMLQSMLTPLQANIRQGLEQSPSFQRTIQQNPKAKAIFDQFLAKQQARSQGQLRENLPGLVDAMTRAYARRFDVGQLEELKRFFATPTGQAYTQASISIMADPDIAAWQRKLMSQAMSSMQDDIATMAKDIEATQQDKK